MYVHSAQQEIAFFASPPCFALHMLSLNSFWWLIYGRVIINFDLVLSPDWTFFFAAQCETRFVKEGLFVVDEAKFKSAMTKQMLPHSVAAWVHIGLKITNFVQECVVSQQKSVHFKKPVARILFFSKLGLFLFWFVLKVPKFWKKQDSRNWLLEINRFYTS